MEPLGSYFRLFILGRYFRLTIIFSRWEYKTPTPFFYDLINFIQDMFLKWCSSVKLVVLTRGHFTPQGTLGNIWTHCYHSSREEGLLLAPSGWRPGIQLSILQFTGQQLMTNNYLVQNVSSAEVEKP